MTEEPATAGDDPAAELEKVRAQLRAVREQRMALQRTLAQVDTVEAAIGSVERDMDTLTSGPVARSREQTNELTERLLATWASIDWYRVVVTRLDVLGMAVDTLPHIEQFRAVLDAEGVTRGQVGERFATAGVPIRVPAAASPKLPPHPDREGRAERLRGITEEAVRRQALMKKPTTHRPGDQHGAR